MRKIKDLFEAMHPSQLSGAYQVMLRKDEIDKIEWPVFFKREGVLVADVVSGSKTVHQAPHATVYILGTRNPYDKLRSFMDTQYGIELDEHDFGVGVLIKDKPGLPDSMFPDIQEVHARMREAMVKAKVV
jgi:hypothetical protein